MLKFGIPLIPAQIGAFIVHLSDRFFIKGYCSIADAGLYSLGYRFGALPSHFISAPFNQTWQPRRFEVYKHEGSEKVFGQIFTYFLFLMFFAGLVISVLTKDVLMIIADESFWTAYKIVPIIVLATTVFSFHYHLNMGILIAKKTKYLAYINFSNGILILLLNFLLIPRYGIYGAAYATLIAFIYKVTLTYYFSSKYYKIHFEFVRIGKLLITSAIIYISTLPIQYSSGYINFLIKSGVILFYPVFLLGIGFYTKEELNKMIAFVKLRLHSIKNIFHNGTASAD
jgi:O-antigen/teichoic acid export membrane protein